MKSSSSLSKGKALEGRMRHLFRIDLDLDSRVEIPPNEPGQSKQVSVVDLFDRPRPVDCRVVHFRGHNAPLYQAWNPRAVFHRWKTFSRRTLRGFTGGAQEFLTTIWQDAVQSIDLV